MIASPQKYPPTKKRKIPETTHFSIDISLAKITPSITAIIIMAKDLAAIFPISFPLLDFIC